MEELTNNLKDLEAYLVDALNAALRGECKSKGAARIECALAVVMDIREQFDSYERRLNRAIKDYRSSRNVKT